MERESLKISKVQLKSIRQLKEVDGKPITWHLEKAVANYLKAKKVA